MRDPFTAFTNTNGVVFPDTEAVNASGPSETDGTEFVKIGIDDGMDWGAAQALLDAAGLTPNGSAEAVGNSQKLDAMEILFGIPDKFISGLVPSLAADADHDITISPGEARSELASSLVRILLDTAITKQIDANWVAGNDVGGFPSGLTLTADTWYHLFLIKNNTTGVVDAGFDTSLTATNLLADATGYTEFRYVDSRKTDGSSNIIAFFATEMAGGGIHVLLETMVQEFSESPPATTEQTKTLSFVPTDIRVEADITALYTHTAAVHVLIDGADVTLPAASSTARTLTVSGGTNEQASRMRVLTNDSAQIKYRSSSTSGTLSVYTYGYIIPRR